MLRLFLFFVCNLTTLLASEKIVSAQVMGGLGNQLFQIANGLAVGWDYDYTPIFPRLMQAESRLAPRPVYWNTVFHKIQTHSMGEDLRLASYHEENSLRYRKIEPISDRIKFFGYFQSAKYFDHQREKILDTFQLPSELQAIVEQKYQEIVWKENDHTVSIHIRLDDTFATPVSGVIDFWRQPYDSYYDAAIAMFPGDVTFVVFSDNCDWSREYMKEKLKNRRAVYVCNEDYIDLFLMAHCKHNILINSTYSWWGAYLNKNPDKIVVSPKYWQKKENTPYRYEMLMPNWILIDNVY